MIMLLEIISLGLVIASNPEIGSTIPKESDFIQDKQLAVSFSYKVYDFKKLYLQVNTPDLEKLDLEQPLTTTLKEQLIIYNMFTFQFLWSEYHHNERFKTILDEIANVLKVEGVNCPFEKRFDNLVKSGCSEVYFSKDEGIYNVNNRHSMCTITRQNERIYFTQSDLSENKLQEKILYMTCAYYKKGLYKKMIVLGELMSKLENEISRSLKDTNKVTFEDVKISSKAFKNLVNLCLFDVLHNIFEIPNRAQATVDCAII